MELPGLHNVTTLTHIARLMCPLRSLWLTLRHVGVVRVQPARPPSGAVAEVGADGPGKAARAALLHCVQLVVGKQGLHLGRRNDLGVPLHEHMVQDAERARAFSAPNSRQAGLLAGSQAISSMLMSPGMSSWYGEGRTFGGHSASRLISNSSGTMMECRRFLGDCTVRPLGCVHFRHKARNQCSF